MNFHNMIKIQFDKRIKRIRANNTREFISTNKKDYYVKEGITLETTCPHTPQHNGVVERKHRHILEIAHTLKFEANLIIKFWRECVLAATYIINRLPSKATKNMTPYGIFFGKKPYYDHIWKRRETSSK